MEHQLHGIDSISGSEKWPFFQNVTTGSQRIDSNLPKNQG